MEKSEQLKEVIARYWQLSPEGLDWQMEMSGSNLANFSSLRLLRFLASVEERFRISIADVEAIKRFEDLRRLVETS